MTDEGWLCYLACEYSVGEFLIVPVLEWGLELIGEWDFFDKQQNNHILVIDRSGRRCDALRDMLETEQ